MVDVVIIGGGIAGLTCAWRLHRAGRSVVVLERESKPGGSISTVRKDGYLLEMGPNTIQRSNRALEHLIDELDLASEVTEALPAANRRYIVRDGRPVPVPSGILDLITTDLLSWRARLGILAEPFRRKQKASSDESVADFVRRRLGQEFLDYTIDPFVSGVYAGDPERLSMRSAFPRMIRMEDESGSLVRGAVRSMRRRGAPPKWKMFSFRDGLQMLPETIVAELSDVVRLNSRAESIERHDGKWHVRSGEDELHARSIVLAVPMHVMEGISMPASVRPRTASDVVYPPLAVVHTAFDRRDVLHPLDGFGALVPSRETSITILGALFTSSLFAGRAPSGHVVLTSFIGGRRRPEVLTMRQTDIHRRVEADLASLFGARGEPTFRSMHLWKHAIPQYEIGYDGVQSELAQIESVNDGLFFTGNFRDGISVGQTIETSEAVADRVLELLGA